jgi:hypothetical protein
MSRTFLRESNPFQLKPNAAQSRGGSAEPPPGTELIVDDVGVVEDAAESRHRIVAAIGARG